MYNTKAKVAWEYIDALRPALNIETQVLQNCLKNIKLQHY